MDGFKSHETVKKKFLHGQKTCLGSSTVLALTAHPPKMRWPQRLMSQKGVGPLSSLM